MHRKMFAILFTGGIIVLLFQGIHESNASNVELQDVATWRNMNPSTHPSGRNWMAMAYDSESDKVILFGGWADGRIYADTWAYDYKTNTWTNMNPSESPPPRYQSAMAYDSESDRVILFGGYASSGYLHDTWAYDYNTNTWTRMNPSTYPSARNNFAMVYNSKRDIIILYAGYSGSALSDMWAYNYNINTWTQLYPTSYPISKYVYAMAYDSESDKVILFGGYSSSGTILDQTWAYDYDTNTWLHLNPPVIPRERYNFAMVYDSESDRIILYGGYSSSSDIFRETWTYDYNSNTWAYLTLSSQPTSTYRYGFAYNSRYDVSILFGGTNAYDETWAFDYRLAPRVTNTYPSNNQANVPINTQILITFNMAMNQSATESAITTYPSFTWTSQWSGDSRTVTLTPTTSLDGFTTYFINITTDAKGQNGVNMQQMYSFYFHTGMSADTRKPSVMLSIPTNGTKNVSMTQPVVILFSESMNPSATESAILISPTTSILRIDWFSDYTSMYIYFVLRQDVIYTVTITTDAMDTAGNNLDHEFTFSFTTEVPPSPPPPPPPPPSTQPPVETTMFVFPEFPYYYWIIFAVILVIIFYGFYSIKR